jgi:hypothetical protein
MGKTAALALVLWIVGLASFQVQAVVPSDKTVLSYLSQTYISPEEASRNLGAFAAALEAREDRRSLFPHIYALTVGSTAARLAHGDFENPKWVRALVINYANIYRRTIWRELTGQCARLPLAWQLDFSYNQRAKHWAPDLDVVYGISVHISHDLVEALFVTPTNFRSPSIERDFFRISQTLSDTMPAIWAVFTRYGDSMGLPPTIEKAVMNAWIARLRQRAWNDAQSAAEAPPAEKMALLAKIDQVITELARRYGVTLALQP